MTARAGLSRRVGWGAAAALMLLGCQGASLEGRACPCATGYTCCESLQLCLGAEEVCVDLPAWQKLPAVPAGPPPVSTENLTVFAFSQVGTDGSLGDGQDTQVMQVAPDLVIRGWGQWDKAGTQPSQYDGSFVDQCHQAKIRFMGGGTATALFTDQVADDVFQRWVTRDAGGDPVSHDALNPGEYRASLANPDYRASLIRIGKMQIDAGVDGLQYSDVNADYQGSTNNGVGDYNEGFDDYHLADFNAFLLAQHPNDDYRTFFGMDDGNLLRADRLAGDLSHNFNYGRYLRERGLQGPPFSSGDALSAAWGQTAPGMPSFGAATFVDTAEPYRYWKDIVTQLRSYAAFKGRAPFYVSANGIFPFVDFVSWGIYDSPEIPQTFFKCFSPAGSDGARHLDGAFNAQSGFQSQRAQAALWAPGAPVVVYLDGLWDVYHQLPPRERRDFWKIYAAEAYANGLFFAFLLKPPPSGRAAKLPNTAQDDDTLDLFVTLAAFYRGHASLYHGINVATEAASSAIVKSTVSEAVPRVAVTVADQVATLDHPARRIVHLVNHEYDVNQTGDSGILEQPNLSITIPVAGPVSALSVASPDFAAGGDQTIAPPPRDGAGTITFLLPALAAYQVIAVSY